MPFIATNLSVRSAANGFTLWHYRTTDSRAETQAAGHFTPPLTGCALMMPNATPFVSMAAINALISAPSVLNYSIP